MVLGHWPEEIKIGIKMPTEEQRKTKAILIKDFVI